MKLFGKSCRLILIVLLNTIFLFSLQTSYSTTNLEVSTTNMGNTLYFSYVFNFSTSSPNSIIAIEKPEDSVFINAFDDEGIEYEPLVIGDFYRFELRNRDTTSFTIQFTSTQILRDLYEENEQLFYVNSNVDLDNITVNFDTVRPYSEILSVYPRNYEVIEDNTRIITFQEGSLNDNLFRINYESNDTMSIWIFVLLSIPILFFVILYISLKAKPNPKDKDLNNYIEKNKNKEVNENNSNTELRNTLSLDNENTNTTKNIVYSFENEEGLDKNTSMNNKSKNSVMDEEKEKSKTTKKNNISIKNNELEEYIQKYFTENEQDVIRIISNNEGLMQQEILDTLTIFTKSTLSKILSKLERKKMIERVKVGKVNKLFIGEDLKKLIKNEKEEDNTDDEEKMNN